MTFSIFKISTKQTWDPINLYILEMILSTKKTARTANAIYVKQDDTLYFQRLSKLTKIFKGIEELYREATDEETIEFLNSSFINLTNGYSTSKVKTANRKRITMALETLSKFNTKEKKQIFKYISEYCNNLEVDENKRTFSIGSE